MGKWVFLIFLGAFLVIIGIINNIQFHIIGAFLTLTGIGGLIFRAMKSSQSLSKGKQWMDKYPQAKYKFSNGDYGIAIDGKKIHLCEAQYTKSYSLTDVRTWRTSLQTGGSIMFAGGGITAAMSTGSMNRQIDKDNLKNSGLFISTRDVNKPEWRIHFSDNPDEEKRQQATWNEIFNQLLRD